MILWLTPLNGPAHYQVLESMLFFRTATNTKTGEIMGTFICAMVDKSGNEIGYYVEETVEQIAYMINSHDTKMRRAV